MRGWARAAWWIGRVGAVLLALVLLSAGWAGWLRFSGNVHAVVDGELYRSAQLSEAQLAEVIGREGIRSIVNLRGRSERSGWWKAETALAKRKGVVHVDLKMSAEAIPDDAKIDRLLTLLRDLPKPILVHCKAGADRTGLAAALYLAEIKGADEDTAEAEMSVRFGHVALPLAQSWPMDQTWEVLEARLGLED